MEGEWEGWFSGYQRNQIVILHLAIKGIAGDAQPRGGLFDIAATGAKASWMACFSISRNELAFFAGSLLRVQASRWALGARLPPVIPRARLSARDSTRRG